MPDRIAIRVTPEEFERLDDIRHKARLSFQQLGLKLLREWADAEEQGQGDNPNTSTEPSLQASEGVEKANAPAIVDSTPGSVYVGYAHQLSKIRKLADQLQQEIEANHILHTGGVAELEEDPEGKKGGAKTPDKARKLLRKPPQRKLK